MNKDDKNTPIAELNNFVKEFRKARGWAKYNDPYDLAAALSVEAGEILELLLWGKDQDFKAIIASEPKLKEKLGEELVDVFSYVLILADTIGVDLTRAFFAKMEKNSKKYPIIENSITPRRKRWLE